MKLIGSDIEYALFNLSTQSYEPAGVLPINGTKGNPDPLMYGGVEIDCCGVEITPKPGASAAEFAHNILSLKEEVADMHPGYRLDCVSELTFESKVLEEIRYANHMGCSFDLNAWSGARNIPPNPRQARGYRTFGGHVHIEGGTPLTVLVCDLLLGLWSAAVDKTGRRKLYGKAGAFREKPYGVEYRVLSNFWCDRASYIKYVFSCADKARHVTPEDMRSVMSAIGITPSEVENVINSNQLSISDYEMILSRGFPEQLTAYDEVRNAA